MELYKVIADWTGWPIVVALMIIGGGYAFWMLNNYINILKEQNNNLEKEMKQLKEYSPDILAQRLASRHKLLTEELERLNADHKATQAEIKNKKKQINELKSDISYFEWQLSIAKGLLSGNNLVCPYCDAPLSVKEYDTDPERTGSNTAVLEHIVYECGYEILDGEQIQDCSRIIRLEDYETSTE